MRGRDENVGTQDRPGDVGNPLFVMGIGVGMQQHDRHGLDPFPLKEAAGLDGVVLVQFAGDVAGRGRAFPHLPAQVARHESIVGR